MSEKPASTTYTHTTSYIISGIPYALTSISALFAGYLIQVQFVSIPLLLTELLILAIPIIASIYFFMCYAERFPTPKLQVSQKNSSDNPEESHQNSIEVAMRGEAIYIYLFLAISLIGNAILSAFLLASLSTRPLPLWIVFTFLIYAGMYGYYGLFLWKHPDPNSIPVIRHQLVWSVVLSIGMSLYYGVSFSNLVSSWLPLVPVLIVAVVYLITKLASPAITKLSDDFKARLASRIKWRVVRYIFRILSSPEEIWFLVIMLFFFFGLTILAFFIKKGAIFFLPVELGEYFFIIQFCIIVSAYLAVFESWKVTSDIAIKEQKRTKTAISENADSEANRYSMATLMALVTSVGILPFFFMFSQYGIFFLVSFGLHSLFSFWYWSYWGKGQTLVKFNWGMHKMWVGIVFLIILVLASLPIPFFNAQPESHTLKDAISWDVAGILFGFTLFPITMFGRDLFNRHETLLQLFNERINFARVLACLSWVACAAILLIIKPIYSENSVVYYKGELAFIFYSICIVICCFAEFMYQYKKPRTKTGIVNVILAMMVLVRAVTSLLIAFAVFLPSVYTGKGLLESSLKAIPFFLSAVGGFALNDYFDAEKDLINKPYRAIPSGKLSRSFVLLFSLVSLSLAIFTAGFFSQNNLEFVLYLLCIAGVISYNVFVKYLSLSKTFLTSTVSALPILFSVIIFEYPKIYLLLPAATCSFVLGREWLMDIRDVKGDVAGRIKTIPMIIGSTATAKFGFGFQILAVLLLLPIVVYNQSYLSALLLAIIMSCVAIFVPLWSYHSGILQQWVVRLLWVPMLMGLLLFIK